MSPPVVVLCYHGISDMWPSPTAVPPALFALQLERFLEEGYVGATFTRAVLDPPAARTVAVTFDDGYRSILEHAVPVLERLGLPGTLFVPTDRLGRGEPLAWPTLDAWLGTEHEPELSPMSWPEIAGLAESGWEIGAHTVSHPHLQLLDDAELRHELVSSKADVETRLGRPCVSVAYPYGDADERVVEAAGEAGFETGAGLHVDRRRPLHWPRVCVARPETPERLWLHTQEAA